MVKKGLIFGLTTLILLSAGTAIVGVGSNGFKNWDTSSWFNNLKQDNGVDFGYSTFDDALLDIGITEDNYIDKLEKYNGSLAEFFIEVNKNYNNLFFGNQPMNLVSDNSTYTVFLNPEYMNYFDGVSITINDTPNEDGKNSCNITYDNNFELSLKEDLEELGNNGIFGEITLKNIYIQIAELLLIQQGFDNVYLYEYFGSTFDAKILITKSEDTIGTLCFLPNYLKFQLDSTNIDCLKTADLTDEMKNYLSDFFVFE